MSIQLMKHDPCVDYSELIDIIETQHNIVTRDFSGRWSKENLQREKDAQLKWMDENGYAGKEHVLNSPDPDARPYVDWDRDSEEMKLRTEIWHKYRDIREEEHNKIPHQDYWDLFCGNITNGCTYYLDFEELLIAGDYEDWVAKINNMIREEVKDSPAYHAEFDHLLVYISW